MLEERVSRGRYWEIGKNWIEDPGDEYLREGCSLCQFDTICVHA